MPYNTFFLKVRHCFHAIVVVCLLTTQTLHASWQIPIMHYSPVDYEGGTQNWQMAQQQNGWIYAANNYGLLEFDGETWSLYGVWNSTTIHAVLPEKNCMYVGATNDFGVFRPNAYGGLVYEPLTTGLTEAECQFGEIWSITRVGDCLYFQARHHVFRLSDDGDITVVYSPARIYCCTAHDGALYAATSDGVSVLSGTKLVTIHGSSQLQGLEIRSLCELDDDRLLIATDFKGFYVLDNNEILPFKTEADAFLRRNQLYTCAVRDGQLAVGTVLDGVVLMDTQGGNCRYISTHDGLQNNTVLSLMFDSDGNLWAGLDQGIDCILLSLPLRYLADGTEMRYGAGYAAQAFNGNLYLGTNQGLYVLRNFDVANPSRLTNTKVEFVEGSLGQVWSLTEVDGRLLCCHNRGLYEVVGNRLRLLCDEEGFWRIRPLRDGQWIAGTYRGFYRIDGGGVYRLPGVDETALQFEVDVRGEIWLCTLHGLQHIWLNETGDSLRAEYVYRVDVPHNYVNIACVLDTVYMCSEDFVYRVDANGSGDAKHALDWLAGMQLYGFLQVDADGSVWYQVHDAIHVKDKDGRCQTPINKHLTIPGFANLYCLGNGNAILGGEKGFYLLSANGETLPLLSDEDRHLYVRQIQVISPFDSVVYGENLWSEDRIIELPAADYSLQFQMGVSFMGGQDILYATYLEPMEKNYSSWTVNSSKMYNGLKAGNYTLHMRAMVRGQVLERTLSFRILPPWYRTWWANTMYGVALVLLLVGVLWYVQRKLRESKRRFEQEKIEELRESKMKILELENEKNQIELQSKSQELSNLLLKQVNKNELVSVVLEDVRRVMDSMLHDKHQDAMQRLKSLQSKLQKSSDADVDWKRFEDNFDAVNASFLKNLTRKYPWMTKNEKKLCVYIKMGLLTKEMAPLMRLTTRGVEMVRYRMRQKMELDPQVNLKEYFEQLSEE